MEIKCFCCKQLINIFSDPDTATVTCASLSSAACGYLDVSSQGITWIPPDEGASGTQD